MAQSEFDQAVADANVFGSNLLDSTSLPDLSSNGDLKVDGEVILTGEELSGQREDDYLPADYSNTFGSDSATLIQGKAAQDTYEQTTLSVDSTSGEMAYHIVNNTASMEMPDLTNDSIWDYTDQIIDNLEEISEGFANCSIETELISTGNTYHIPKYETCTILPAVEETFYMGHDYDVGVVEYESGPVNMASCGTGCTRIWIGEAADGTYKGSCDIFEEEMSVRVLQPDAITYAVLERAKFDDYFQVYLNDNKIYNGPNANFPPETTGKCELETSWNKYPNINITSNFTNVAEDTVIDFQTRVSVSGTGEGYATIVIQYDNDEIVYDESWNYDDEDLENAFKVKEQIEDGYCTGSITCTDNPVEDYDEETGCGTVNGVYVCESDFKENPWEDLGISPFCKAVEVVSDCGFNEGDFCYTNADGDEVCIENDTVNTNTCDQYEEDETCSYVSTSCVEGAEGESGTCYVQEDMYDCGYDVSTGVEEEQDVLVCDGQIRCIGDDCYSATQDTSSGSFAEVSAYLEVLRYAASDMTCEGVADGTYDADNPPDQYEPVPSCTGDGYVYNSYLDACLLENVCQYDENNFYVASPRYGIQVVENNVVQVENSAIQECVPVVSDYNNSIYFTCGDAQSKISTNTYYEVCENSYSTALQDTCPTDYHQLNESTGYCEVPPSGSCPDGYDYIEGDDPWSMDDDYCLDEREHNLKCEEGYSLNDNDICELTVTEEYTYYCPDGYTKTDDGFCIYQEDKLLECTEDGFALNEDGVCEKVEEEQYSYYCEDGYTLTDDGTHCLLTVDANQQCPDGYTNLGNGTCEQTTTQEYTLVCADGYALNESGTACVYSESSLEQCPDGYTENDEGICAATSAIDLTKTCPDGYTMSEDGTQCVYSEDTLLECSSGYTLNSEGVCEKVDTEDYSYYCPDGYAYSDGKCYYSESVDTETTCELYCDEGELNDDGLCEVTTEASTVCGAAYMEYIAAFGGGVNEQFYIYDEDGNKIFSDSNVTASEQKKYFGTGVVVNGVTYTMDEETKVEDYYYYIRYTYDACFEQAGTTETTDPDEVCTTEVGECSNSDATYDADTGMCTDVVSAVGYCPDGYVDNGGECELVSYEDAVDYCEDGLIYDEETGLCFDVKDITATCPDGYVENGDTCVKTEYADMEVYCADGLTYDEETGLCFDTEAYTETCPDGYANTGSKCELVETEVVDYYCADGFVYDDETKTCYDLDDAYSTCPDGYTDTGSMCSLTTLNDPNIYCNSDYIYDESTGYCYDLVDLLSTCPDGYTDTGEECSLTTYDDAILYCEDGYTYDEDTGICYDIQEAEASCPVLYPNWNEEEGRCESESNLESLLGSNQTMKSTPGTLPGTLPDAGDVLDSVLFPFNATLSALFPSAHADDEIEGTVTQESMEQYIGEKFLEMKENGEATSELVSAGKSQLISTFSSSFATTSSTVTSDEEIDYTNVTCELFSGEAQECKIAVGGMQNCCESPVATSLSDYIKLTRNVMAMDAATGQVFGLESYTGAWDALSEGASAAYDSLFTSAADVAAESAGTTATDEAATELMAEIGQQMMTYANDWLVDNFGQEVANYFFTTGADGAIGASTQMAAVGQAMAYVYYAYLAYVTFTLLVNIVYACSDEELDLAMKNELLSTHYLGSYCATEVLGVCIEKRKSYCSFDSPFSRILMEQIYMQEQMGLSWGTAKNPNCNGIAIEDLSLVDWDQVNLDEWIAMLIDADAIASEIDLNLETLTGVGSSSDFSGTTNNVIESVDYYTSDIDGDEIRTDAYDDLQDQYE